MRGHQHTALVVEDDEAIRGLLVEVLEQEGFAVHAADDGVAAIELLGEALGDYCVILLDLMLPKLSGLDVLRHIRRGDRDLSVIAMSASQAHLIEAIQVGATQALSKPFDIEDLLATVTCRCAAAA
jgi:DNA-binding response OmpR family regulator